MVDFCQLIMIKYRFYFSKTVSLNDQQLIRKIRSNAPSGARIMIIFQGKHSVHLRISMEDQKDQKPLIRNSVLFIAVLMYLFLRFSILWQKNRNRRFRMAHMIFLNLPDQIKVCSATGVFRRGNSFPSGRHCRISVFDLAFRVFMVFHMQAIHNFSHFEPHQIIRLGKGQWFLSYGSLSRLHILSQAAITSSHLLSSMPSSRLRRY